eukprot:1160390-Pelagomonas_calceolata.AAC.8
MSPSFKGLRSSHPPHHSVRCGTHTVGGIIYTPHTLDPLKEFGLDTHKATEIVLHILSSTLVPLLASDAPFKRLVSNLVDKIRHKELLVDLLIPIDFSSSLVGWDAWCHGPGNPTFLNSYYDHSMESVLNVYVVLFFSFPSSKGLTKGISSLN